MGEQRAERDVRVVAAGIQRRRVEGAADETARPAGQQAQQLGAGGEDTLAATAAGFEPTEEQERRQGDLAGSDEGATGCDLWHGGRVAVGSARVHTEQDLDQADGKGSAGDPEPGQLSSARTAGSAPPI